MDKIVKNQAILFIGDSNTKQKMVRTLEKLSYQTVIIPFITDNTMEQIKSVPYKVIVLEEGFQNLPLRENPIYREMIHMTMSLRRGIFLILLGKEINHLVPIGAFSMSANLLLDIEKIEEEDLVPLLQQEISQYFQIYQVYNMAKKQINQGGSFL